jgi:L-threonylcarbamoyladenylate synthase
MITLQQIEDAAKIIREGGLVAFPTETVYGLGANALNPDAVARIFIEKERPSFDPLIVHINSTDYLPLLCKNPHDYLYKLAEAFWPGPLTMVVPKSKIVPDIVTSGLPTVAIRMPANAVALKLIESAGCPIAAPSANKFGRLSPTSAQHVKKQLPGVDCILDGGKSTIGIESTVISVTSAGFDVLRYGSITRQQIELFLPYMPASAKQVIKQASPGFMKSHYSPVKPLFFIDDKSIGDTSNAGIVSFAGNNIKGFKAVEILSANADLKEAAINLFGALHRLEEAEIDFIVVEPVPEIGIGLAIMDRLRKAAYQYTRESQTITNN